MLLRSSRSRAPPGAARPFHRSLHPVRSLLVDRSPAGRTRRARSVPAPAQAAPAPGGRPRAAPASRCRSSGSRPLGRGGCAPRRRPGAGRGRGWRRRRARERARKRGRDHVHAGEGELAHRPAGLARPQVAAPCARRCGPAGRGRRRGGGGRSAAPSPRGWPGAPSRRWARVHRPERQVGEDVGVVEEEGRVAAQEGRGAQERRPRSPAGAPPREKTTSTPKPSRARPRSSRIWSPRWCRLIDQAVGAGRDQAPRDALQDGHAAHLDQRLGGAVGERAQPRAQPRRQEHRVHGLAPPRRRAPAGRPALAARGGSTSTCTSGKRSPQVPREPLGEVDGAVLAAGAPEVDAQAGEAAGEVGLHLVVDQARTCTQYSSTSGTRLQEVGPPARRSPQRSAYSA